MFFDYFSKYYIRHEFGASYILTILIMVLEIVLVFNDYSLTFKRQKDEKPGFLNMIKSFFTRESNQKGLTNLRCLLYFLSDLAVTYIVQILIFCTAEFFLGSHNYINYIVWPLMVVGHAFFINMYSWFERIAKGGVLITVLLLEPVLSQIIGAPFGQYTSSIFPYIAVIVFFIIGSFTIWMLRTCSMKNFAFSNPVCLILIAFLTVWSFILIVFLKIEPNDPGDYSFDYAHFLLFFGLLAFSEVTYYLYYETLVEHDRALRNQATAFKAENDNQMLQLSLNNMENLRKLRHDIKNKYQYMKVLFESGDKEKLKSFFSDMCETAFVPLSFVDTGNSSVSAIMNTEINKANSSGVVLTTSIVVPPKIDLSDYDLCSFIYNIVDNAIEGACSSQGEKKVVNAEINYKKPYVYFYVENSTSLESFDPNSSKTTKNNPSLHGCGNKIVSKIVQKYNGSISYNVDQGLFKVNAMLLEKTEEKGK